MSYPVNQYGSFLQTNFIWEIEQIYQLDEITPDFKELLVRLYQNLGLTASVVNSKETGLYQSLEFINGQQFFPNPAYNSGTNNIAVQRSGWRRCITNFGTLPNAGTKSVPHYIDFTPTTAFTRIYAAATNPGNAAIPIPNVDLVNPVSINLDSTNVNITTVTNLSAYVVTIIVLEFLKT